jgi:hypothetical protein
VLLLLLNSPSFVRVRRPLIVNLFSLENQMWFASLLNAGLVFHQLYTLYKKQTAEGLSLVMMGGFLYMQVIYAIHGYNTKNEAMLIGMGLSAIFNIIILLGALHLKYAPANEEADVEC